MTPKDPQRHDPTRLMRFMARHALTGAVAGWAALLLLLQLDVGGLGSLVRGADSREAATAALALLFGTTFGLIGISWGVLVLLPHED